MAYGGEAQQQQQGSQDASVAPPKTPGTKDGERYGPWVWYNGANEWRRANDNQTMKDTAALAATDRKQQKREAAEQKGKKFIDTVKGVGDKLISGTDNIASSAVAGLGARNNMSRAAGTLDAQAAQDRVQQARTAVDAQRDYQIANRDARVEGDKDAAARAAAQFNQRMAQQSGASGGGAAVLASLNVQDPSTSYTEHRQRADTQHDRATDLQTQSEQAAQNALVREGRAADVNRVQRQEARHNTTATNLATRDPTTPAPTPDTPAPQETPPPAAAPQQELTADMIARVTEAIQGAPPDRIGEVQSALQQVYMLPENERATKWNELRTKYNTEFEKVKDWKAIQDITFNGKYDLNGKLASDARLKNIINVVHRRF